MCPNNNNSVFQNELSADIPVVKTSIAGTRLVGRMTVGNKNGLLLPNSVTDQGERTRQIIEGKHVVYAHVCFCACLLLRKTASPLRKIHTSLSLIDSRSFSSHPHVACALFVSILQRRSILETLFPMKS